MVLARLRAPARHLHVAVKYGVPALENQEFVVDVDSIRLVFNAVVGMSGSFREC